MIGDDKYFVVAMVMAIIFTGLGIYLFLIDRKLSRIERKHEEKKWVWLGVNYYFRYCNAGFINFYFCKQ